MRINAISGAVSTSVVNGLPPFDPTLLGIVADQPIIAAYEREPDRSTFSDLYRIELDGTARLFGDAGGSIYRLWPSSSSSALVFVAGRSSGACYSTDDIGVIAAAPDGDIEVNVPPQPLGDEFAVVRSAQMAADSSLSAAISPLGCDDDGMIEDREPLAERYLFKDGRWSPTGARGFDVQSVAGGIAEVKRSDERSVPGALALVNDGGRLLLAPQIEGLVARP